MRRWTQRRGAHRDGGNNRGALYTLHMGRPLAWRSTHFSAVQAATRVAVREREPKRCA